MGLAGYEVRMVLFYHNILPTLICIFAVVTSISPILGEESKECDATNTSTGENTCTPKDVNHDDMKIINEGEKEEIDRPIWWDYNSEKIDFFIELFLFVLTCSYYIHVILTLVVILAFCMYSLSLYLVDELFEHLDCASIVPGYAEDDDAFYDDDDDDDDSYTKQHSDVVSEEQQQKLRDQWAILSDKYKREVNLVPIEKGKSQFLVPVRIGNAGVKGRGVFATEPILKDTMVADLLNGSTGIFKDARSWRSFVMSLPTVELSCNFIEWCWIQMMPPENENDNDVRNGLTVFIAFDESNLLNSADWDGIEANIRCGAPPKHEGGERGVCRFHFYAARDIAAGEELLINYAEIEDVSQQGWVDFGL